MQGFAVVLLVAIGGLGAWWVLQGLLASPLQPVGSARHDFGVVLIDGKEQTVEHTFLLRNTTDRPLQIIKTVPSCGCTWAGPGEPNLAPGATMELPVTLSVKESHKIDSNIKVVLEGETPLVLWLSAEGRIQEGLRHAPNFIRIKPAHPDATGRLFLEWWGEESPPPPVFNAADSLEIVFAGWELQSRGSERLGTPDRYMGPMEIHAVDTPPINGLIQATMLDGRTTRIPVNPPGSLGEMRTGEPVLLPEATNIEFNPEQVGENEPGDQPEQVPDDH